MRVAVLMTVHNRREQTLACLRTLYAQLALLDGEKYETDVWVNDDGSTDGTADAVLQAFPQVRLTRTDGTFYWSGGLRHVWLAAAEKDYDSYLWLDDKLTLGENAVYSLLDNSGFLGHKAIVVGSVLAPDGSLYRGGRSRGGRLVDPDPVIPKPCYIFDGRLVLVPRAVFERLGVLDGRYRHKLGDYDYAIRAYRAGITRVVAPGYPATAPRKAGIPAWRDRSRSLPERYRALLSPTGKPLKENFLFDLRSKGFFQAVWAMVKLHFQVFFPIRNNG